MIGLETVGAFATLAGVLQTWKAGARGKKELKLQAMRELSAAVVATKKAIKKRPKKGQQFHEVVGAWQRASIAFNASGEKKLSRLCQIKGLYWLDPFGWSPDQVHAAGIQLTAMDRELRRLLAATS